ncbi:MAG: hypothetical protein IJM83_05770 [Firmicutes bacterium]|nr:hypothetical protein [Bacillota bacterium]
MRLFLYYGIHSFFNQLKKIFKSWVLIFILACALIGGGIGAGVGALSNAAEEKAAQESEMTAEEESSEEDPEEIEVEVPDFIDIAENKMNVSGVELVELIAGLVILGIFIFEILSADRNGSKIFLPADVPLLFAAPLAPQTVLMFRIMTQVGTALLASIYLLFQLPNLMLNVGLSLWQALSIIAAWFLTIIIGKLIQVLLYTVCSTRPGWKPYIHRVLYGVLIALALGLIVFYQTKGYLSEGLLGIVKGASDFLNAPLTRFIPFWGWIKGFVRMAIEGNTAMALLLLALCFAGMAVLIIVIWRVKADFYEDAMAKSEETAEVLAKAQEEGSLYFRRRKKDRADSIRRDSMNKGSGANVFFFKAMYNRFRFAHLKIMTKTSDTYLIAGVAVALMTRFMGESDSLVPTALVLAAISFFRSLGNPLTRDAQMSYFTLIPEKTAKKLFYSVLGGTVNCFLDLLIGMVAAVLILGANPLHALMWILTIVSVDLYSSIIVTFLDLSIPVHTAKTIKQIIQIMFIYFGLIPDAIIVAIALVLLDSATIAALGTVMVNLTFAGLFFFLSVCAIDYCFGK